ncbi:MAG: hypothetical protein ACOC22_01100 [bacterium]
MNEFGKEEIKEIRTTLEELFEEIEMELGVKLSIGTIRYDRKSFSTRLEAVIPKEGEFGLSKDEITWKNALKRRGIFHGLSGDEYGQKRRINGKKYILLGISPRSKKYPSMTREISSGSIVKFTEKYWKLARIVEEE